MPTIYLICEDREDAKIVQSILEKKLPQIRVSHVPLTGRKGGIARLAHQLEDVIRVARELRQKSDCIAVLHDADEHTETDRRHHDRIREICETYKDDVFLAIARDAIEAWLLSDEGLCKWLKIKPQSRDGEANPKKTLEGLLRKGNMKWQGPDRAKVLAQLDGSGDKFSDSMRSAISHINC